jgi:FKBP-type peptidyl-prolyl cis-trans isomerase
MKNKIYMVFAIIIAAAVFGACEKKKEDNPFKDIENLSVDASYAMGMSIGAELLNNMISGGIYPDLDEFIKGITDMMYGGDTRISVNNMYEVIDAAFSSIMEERTAGARQAEISFLSENAKRASVNITSSGLQYEVIQEGQGPRPSAADKVLVHYEGSYMDGTVFDSSIQYGEPVEFFVNGVIEGWSEGIQLMNAGSQYIFYIPYALGYGEAGYQNPWTGETLIPGFSTLIFIVELLEIIPDTGE